MRTLSKSLVFLQFVGDGDFFEELGAVVKVSVLLAW